MARSGGPEKHLAAGPTVREVAARAKPGKTAHDKAPNGRPARPKGEFAGRPGLADAAATVSR